MHVYNCSTIFYFQKIGYLVDGGGYIFSTDDTCEPHLADWEDAQVTCTAWLP